VRFDGAQWWWPADAGAEAVTLTPLQRNAHDYLLSDEDFARLSEAAAGGKA